MYCIASVCMGKHIQVKFLAITYNDLLSKLFSLTADSLHTNMY